MTNELEGLEHGEVEVVVSDGDVTATPHDVEHCCDLKVDDAGKGVGAMAAQRPATWTRDCHSSSIGSMPEYWSLRRAIAKGF